MRRKSSKEQLWKVAVGYGRYSSDLQNEESANDQNAENREWVRRQLGENVSFFPFVDKAVPGTQVDRDGLDEAIEFTKRYDRGVFVVENMSRLGRSIGLCMNAIEDLVDRGWRFVCRGSPVDTMNPFWPSIAATMAMCAEIENEARAGMVRRGRRAAFQRGDNVGGIPRIHYCLVLRNPNDPEGGNDVVKRDQFQAEIQEFFERIAAGQTMAEVIRWANSLPDKLGRVEDWELDDGARMIRDPRYKGLLLEGRTKRVLKRKTGRRVAEPNDNPDDVLVREDLRQAFVTPELWQQANQMLDDRNPPGRPRGLFYPREKKNRRSGQWPSGAACCGVCGGKMHRNHGAGTRYICSNAIGDSPTCWNYVSAETKTISTVVGTAVVRELLRMEGTYAALANEVQRQAKLAAQTDPSVACKVQQKLADSKKKLARLVAKIEEGLVSNGINARIQELEMEIVDLAAQVALETATTPALNVPTAADIRKSVGDLETLIQQGGEDRLPPLRVLVPRMDLVPVHVRGVKSVCLRASFDLNLVRLLPAQWRSFLEKRAGHVDDPVLDAALVRRIAVIVTPLPGYTRIARQAAELVGRGVTQEAAGRELGCDPNVIRRALAFQAQQGGDELAVDVLTTLPNRRKKRHAAPRPGDAEGSDAQPVYQQIASRVAALIADGLAPTGISSRLGCKIQTVRRSLQWLSEQGGKVA